MLIREVLDGILKNYLKEKNTEFKDNLLANHIRTDFLDPFNDLLLNYKDRYLCVGSSGQGKWADCPWIGLFDAIITTSAQNGYYLVYLFDKNMNGVYLSLNQGVTEIKQEYKRKAKEILLIRSENFRRSLNFKEKDNIKLVLNSTSSNPKLYECGNILATYYDAWNLPSETILEQDLKRFLRYYQDLVSSDSTALMDENVPFMEYKKSRLHQKFDRSGKISLNVKKVKGYRCEACGFDFREKYGKLGDNFIEAHHLIPFSSLDEGETPLSVSDFAVLCSNCHRMIHRLKDPSDLEGLKKIVVQVAKRKKFDN